MSTDTIRSEIARLKSTEASLKKALAAEQKTSSDARATANKKRQDAARSKSASSIKSAISSAEREEKKAVAADKKIGEISGKLANLSKQQATKEKSLASAEKSELRVRDSQDGARRRAEIAHARNIARRSQPTIHYVPVRAPEPAKLRVLYLTASPDAVETERIETDGTYVREGVWLRVDREVRSVKNAIRGSKYRDLIEIHYMPAATRKDILDGINDVRPHIVHFSGHGGGQSLYMDSDDPNKLEGTDLGFGLLAAALASTTTPPSLIVLNACETLEGAEVLLNAAPVVIGMSEAILDDAASVFAKQFYAAIASAQSVGAALAQARVALEMASLGQEHIPAHICRDDVDIDDLVLVTPP